MPTDVMQLISRVLERTAEKYAAQVSIQAVDGLVPLSEDAVVDVLATQLLNLFGLRQPAVPPPPEFSREDLKDFFDELAKRNHRIATAVGACDCWGEASGCATCDGLGGPGWLVPQKESFEVVVRPALQKLASYRSAVRNGHM